VEAVAVKILVVLLVALAVAAELFLVQFQLL
jgi:hypothetical protein